MSEHTKAIAVAAHLDAIGELLRQSPELIADSRCRNCRYRGAYLAMTWCAIAEAIAVLVYLAMTPR